MEGNSNHKAVIPDADQCFGHFDLLVPLEPSRITLRRASNIDVDHSHRLCAEVVEMRGHLSRMVISVLAIRRMTLKISSRVSDNSISLV